MSESDQAQHASPTEQLWRGAATLCFRRSMIWGTVIGYPAAASKSNREGCVDCCKCTKRLFARDVPSPAAHREEGFPQQRCSATCLGRWDRVGALQRIVGIGVSRWLSCLADALVGGR
jgi:hypothetical protein